MRKHLCLLLFICCLFWPTSNNTWAAKKPSIGEHFVGETLFYDVGFLWFDKAVHCAVNLQRGEKPGEYIAVLWGQTQGFVGWLSSYRERLYLSYMEETDNGRRFRPLHFEKRIISGPQKYREENDFDYDKGRWYLKTFKNERLITEHERPLPASTGFDDVLSALYNLRYGAYGPIIKGNNYILPAFSRDKGLSKYMVHILTQKQQNQHKFLEKTDSRHGYIMNIQIGEEIFGSKNGVLWVWLSPKFVPQRGIAEDVIDFGTDIYGKKKRPKKREEIKREKKKPKKAKATLPSFLKFKSLFPKGLRWPR